LAKRSTIRVCQPGPVARHSAITSGGKRKLINWRGFATRGLPPLLTTARASISSVSSGNSLYSCGLIGCASTRAKSEPEVRREAILFTFIGLSHAEHVANRPTRRVPDDNHPAFQHAKADDSKFAVVLAPVFHLNCRSVEDDQGVFKVQAAFSESLLSLGLVVGQAHQDIVYTKTYKRKLIGIVKEKKALNKSELKPGGEINAVRAFKLFITQIGIKICSPKERILSLKFNFKSTIKIL
jgi:hypothetical protein